MATHWTALVWIVIGFAASLLHLALLKKAVSSSVQLPPLKAKTRISRGLPVRLLLLAPVLLLAARSGFVACIAFVVGSLVGRWLAVYWPGTDKAFSTVSNRQG